MTTIKTNSINKNTFIKILPLLLLPFGAIFEFKINTSILDLATIFLIFSVFLFNFNKFIFSFLLLFFYSFFLYLINSENLINYNLQRLIYSSVLFAPYICLALGAKIKIKAIYLYKLKKYLYFMSLLIAIITLLTHYQILNFEMFQLKETRPLFPFDEPSRLGLYLVAMTTGFYTSLSKIRTLSDLKNSKIIGNLILIILLLWAAITTATTHITFTFGIIIVIFSLNKQNFEKFKEIKNKTLIIFIRNIILLSITLLIIFQVQVLSDRLDFIFNPKANLNLSELSWLNGLENALRSINNSPFWGFGLGSLGNLSNFGKTIYAERTYYILGYNINLYDGYSMAFRLVHDLGLMPFLFLIFNMIKNGVKNYNSSRKNLFREEINIFYLLIGLTLLLGSIIKEPTSSHIIVALGPYLLMLQVI